MQAEIGKSMHMHQVNSIAPDKYAIGTAEEHTGRVMAANRFYTRGTAETRERQPNAPAVGEAQARAGVKVLWTKKTLVQRGILLGRRLLTQLELAYQPRERFSRVKEQLKRAVADMIARATVVRAGGGKRGQKTCAERQAPPSPTLPASFTGQRKPSALRSYEALEDVPTAQGVAGWVPHVVGGPDNRKELRALVKVDRDGYIVEPEGQVDSQPLQEDELWPEDDYPSDDEDMMYVG